MEMVVEKSFVKNGYESELDEFVNQERTAVALQHTVGALLYDKGVELVLFRNHLVDASITEVMRLHNYSREIVQKPIDVSVTSQIAEELLKMDIVPAKIDVGKLAWEWLPVSKTGSSMSDFLTNKLGDFIGTEKNKVKPRDVVLYGFGRIGRLVARELIKQAGKGQQFRLRAIVTRKVDMDTMKKRAALMRNDSVHGPFAGTIIEDYENKILHINGQQVCMIEACNPEDVDYTKYDINNALLIDNTGKYRDKEALTAHLGRGVNKIILTAPGKEIPNIVYGVNHEEFDFEEHDIYSAASCTTNAIVPILKIIEDNLGIQKGHIETVHAYTNDQNLLDNMHKKPRRGRSAAINMVITSTGAGKAVTKVIPSLKDKLTANAVRVPTPNGSLAILNLFVSKETSIEEVNELLRLAAIKGDLVNQINYQFTEELVSSDIIGNTCCAIFDSSATIVSNDKRSIVLYTWYDNEFGYTKQVIRLAKHVAKVRRLIYY